MEIEVGGFIGDAEEIRRELKRRENLYAPQYQNQQFLDVRRDAIIWLAEACEYLALGQQSIFRAVNFFDRVCTMACVERERMLSVGAACVLIASKLQDRYDETPITITDIALLEPKGRIRHFDILMTEMAVLEFLDWSVVVATSFDFCQFYVALGAFSDRGDRCEGRWMDPNDIERQKQHVKYFIEVCAREAAFLQYPPSLCAAAAFASARRATKVLPTWSDNLTTMTGYTQCEIEECSGLLLQVLQTEQMQQDSGDSATEVVLDNIDNNTEEAPDNINNNTDMVHNNIDLAHDDNTNNNTEAELTTLYANSHGASAHEGADESTKQSPVKVLDVPLKDKSSSPANVDVGGSHWGFSSLEPHTGTCTAQREIKWLEEQT